MFHHLPHGAKLATMREAGLVDVRVVESGRPIFGSIVYLTARGAGQSPADGSAGTTGS